MPVISTSGDKVDVYQFQSYSTVTDAMQKSSRYGTRQAIEQIAKGQILHETKRQIDRRLIQLPHTDIDGMTQIDFNPDHEPFAPATFQVGVK